MTIASGSESQVNSTTTGDQTAPQVMATPDGGYVVVWQTPSAWALQRFAADGSKIGDEVDLPAPVIVPENNLTTEGPISFDVNVLPDGRLVYAYGVAYSLFGDYYKSTITTGTLNADGSAARTESNFTHRDPLDVVKLAVAPDGNVLLLTGTFVRLLDSDTGAIRSSARISDAPLSSDSAHKNATSLWSVMVAPDGSFLTYWYRDAVGVQTRYVNPDGSLEPIFDTPIPKGAAVVHGRGELHFAWIEEDENGNPNVAVGSTDGASFEGWWTGGVGTDPSDVNLWQLADGRLLVTWTASSSGDGDGNGVMGQLVADGVPIGDAFVINSGAAGDQSDVSIAALGDGRFVATWQTPDSDGSGISSRMFDPKSLTGTDEPDLLIGGAFGDTIVAGDGGDTLDGEGGNDSIDAGAGDDVIYGSEGDDTVDGGDGEDAYYVGGTAADWMFGRDGDGNILVQWVHDPSYGIKTLINVETFRFGDDSELSFLDGLLARPDLVASIEDTATTVSIASLLANDFDAGGLGLSFVSAQGAQHGSLSVANGNITFTPTANYNGPATFTYTVKNTAGVESTGTVTINIAAVNDNPAAVSDAIVGYQSVPRVYAAAELLGNDTDIDGDTLAITAVSNATHGIVVLNSNGTVTFTPDANFSGAGASFRYTVSDGHGGTATGTANVFVEAPNRAPVANDDSYSTTGPVFSISEAALLANDTDADGDVLMLAKPPGQFSMVTFSKVVGGTAHYIDGNVHFFATSGFTGVASFTYQATDGIATSNEATVRINVSPLVTIPLEPPGPFEPPVIPLLPVSGTSQSDLIERTSHAEDIRGRGGHDTIKAAGGDDRLRGESGNDKLYGGSGRDTLVGGNGKDSLSGGSYADAFVFNLKPSTSNVDTISDFKHNTDVIQLENSVFKTIGPTLEAGEFFAKRGATKAHDADDRIVYDKSTGKLYYDDDGKGGHAAVHFATLSNKPTLDHGDFAIV